MKSKIINFGDGLLGLKHRRGEKNIKKENQDDIPANSASQEIIDVSSKSSSDKKVKIYSKADEIRNILIEIFEMHRKMLLRTGGNLNSFMANLMSGDGDHELEEASRVTTLMHKLSDLSGYSIADLLLKGKFEQLVYDYNVLDSIAPRYDFVKSSSSRFIDDDDDDDRDFYSGNDFYSDDEAEIFTIRPVNRDRRRIKEIIREIYDDYCDSPIIKKSEIKGAKLTAADKKYVKAYKELVDELEDLSHHEAPQVYKGENLFRLAKRYKVKLGD